MCSGCCSLTHVALSLRLHCACFSDGCGPDRNVTRFAELVDASAGGGRTIAIEDCNDDANWDRGSADCTHFHDTGCAVSGGGFYRVAGDVSSGHPLAMSDSPCQHSPRASHIEANKHKFSIGFEPRT